MSFNDLELKRIDRTVGELCRRSTRSEDADQLRFECEIDGHAVSIWEARPPWDGTGEWMRRDLKWHLYDPALSTPDLAAFVGVVDADQYGAFFG